MSQDIQRSSILWYTVVDGICQGLQGEGYRLFLLKEQHFFLLLIGIRTTERAEHGALIAAVSCVQCSLGSLVTASEIRMIMNDGMEHVKSMRPRNAQSPA